MKRSIIATMLVFALAGCGAMRSGPIVDIRPEQQNQYQNDLGECSNLANNAGSAGQGAMTGAFAGVLVGAALGAAIGDSHTFAKRGAATGAISGAVSGAAHGQRSYEQVLRNCLRGRGWNVLN